MATIPKSKTTTQPRVVAKAPASKISPLQTPISSPDILPPMMPALRTPARPIVAPKPIAGAAPRAATPGSKINPANYIDEKIGAFTPAPTPVKTIQRTPTQRAVAPGAKVDPLIQDQNTKRQFAINNPGQRTPFGPGEIFDDFGTDLYDPGFDVRTYGMGTPELYKEYMTQRQKNPYGMQGLEEFYKSRQPQAQPQPQPMPNPIDQPFPMPFPMPIIEPGMPGGPGGFFPGGTFPGPGFNPYDQPGGPTPRFPGEFNINDQGLFGVGQQGQGQIPDDPYMRAMNRKDPVTGNTLFGGQQGSGIQISDNAYLPGRDYQVGGPNDPEVMARNTGIVQDPYLGGQQNSFNPNPNPGQQAPLNLSSTMGGQQAMQQAPQNMAQMGASTGGKSAGRGGMNTSFGGGKSR